MFISNIIIKCLFFQGKVAYYPVIFSKFEKSNPASADEPLAQDGGFWREYGFGMVSLYQSDFAKSGGFDVDLQGWGLEDVHLVTNFILKGNVSEKYKYQ